METELRDHEEFVAYFWDRNKYASFIEADKNNDTTKGELCYGYSNFLDAMCNAEIVASMVNPNADIRYIIIADGEQYD